MSINFKTVDNSKWEKLTPAPKSSKEDKYVPVLDALESGEIVEIETKDAKEQRGIRITLGRKSKTRGFSVEYRSEGQTLYVKKSNEEVTPSSPKKRKEKQPVEA